MMSAAAAMIMGTLVIALVGSYLIQEALSITAKFSDRTPPCRSIAVHAAAQAAQQRAADQLAPAPEATEREGAGL